MPRATPRSSARPENRSGKTKHRPRSSSGNLRPIRIKFHSPRAGRPSETCTTSPTPTGAATPTSSDLKKTLGRTVDDLNKLLTDPKTSDAKKKDLTKELMAVQASQAAIDSELEQAKSVKQGAEERIKKLVADYDKAFGALKDNVK